MAGWPSDEPVALPADPAAQPAARDLAPDALTRSVDADQPPARRDERSHQALSLVEAGAEHRSARGACRDPLAHDGELEEGERLVPLDVRHVEARARRIAADQL